MFQNAIKTQALESAGIAVAGNPSAALAAATDKWQVAQALGGAGYPTLPMLRLEASDLTQEDSAAQLITEWCNKQVSKAAGKEYGCNIDAKGWLTQ